MKYSVLVTRDRTESALIEVEASTKLEASDMALRKAETSYDVTWALNDDAHAKAYLGAGVEEDVAVVKTKRFNHAFIIAFSVESDADAEHVSERELLEGLWRRLQDLERNPNEALEACGTPFDTYILQ